MKLEKICIIGLLVGQCLASRSIGAGMPPCINYQGKLATADGSAVTDGVQTLRISIYDAATAGQRIWGPQTFTNVAVVAGRFNIVLGPKDDSGSALARAFSDTKRYLELTVGQGLPVGPRQQILSTSFTLSSDYDVPIGAIIPWVPPVPNGSVLTMEAARNLVPVGFALCEGSRTNDNPNTAFDERRIPDLTDGRFLRGCAVTNLAQSGGGSSHQHDFFPPGEKRRTSPGIGQFNGTPAGGGGPGHSCLRPRARLPRLHGCHQPRASAPECVIHYPGRLGFGPSSLRVSMEERGASRVKEHGTAVNLGTIRRDGGSGGEVSLLVTPMSSEPISPSAFA